MQKSIELGSESCRCLLHVRDHACGSKVNFPQRCEKFKKAIELKPDYAEAYYTLGTVLKQMNQLPDAATALREAIRLQPTFAGAHTTLAAVLRQMGDTSAAESEAQLGDSLVKQKIGLQGATFATNSGKRMLDAGDLDGAISQFRTAIKLAPNLAVTHYQLSLALCEKEKSRKPRQSFSVPKSWIPSWPSNLKKITFLSPPEKWRINQIGFVTKSASHRDEYSSPTAKRLLTFVDNPLDIKRFSV